MPRTIASPQHRVQVDFIIAKRKKSGLTQHGLAARLGVSQSYISRIETGQQRVDYIELKEFARVLHFSIRELDRKLAKVKQVRSGPVPKHWVVHVRCTGTGVYVFGAARREMVEAGRAAAGIAAPARTTTARIIERISFSFPMGTIAPSAPHG